MKNVLITGTSSGFGKATADHLTALGFKVIGTSRNPENLTSTHQLIKLDVTDDASVKLAVKTAHEKLGSIDVLINNAGYGLSGPIEDTTIGEAKAQVDTNFFGAVRTTQAILPIMRKQKKGLIINIGSLGGMIGMPYQAFYSASKFALEGYTEALRIEVKPFGIDVVNINPGDYNTEITGNRKAVKNLNTIYAERYHKFVDHYKKDESNGNNPKEVAILVERLIKKGSPYKVRYLTGKFSQTAAIRLKKFLSSRMFEKILTDNYNK